MCVPLIGALVITNITCLLPVLGPHRSQLVLGRCGVAGDWGGLWSGRGVLGAGEMQARGLQKSLQISPGWRQSLISPGCSVTALQELMLPGCSGAGEDTGGPFHLSPHRGRILSQDLRSLPWSPPPLSYSPARCKEGSGLPVLPTSPCRLSCWENQTHLLIYIMLIAVI